MFTKLTLTDWRQFGSIDINFHPRLTILTGANGTGKTTILNLLSRHFGWTVPLIGVPERDKHGLLSYFVDLFRRKHSEPKELEIGSLSYKDGASARLTVNSQPGQAYNIAIQPQQAVEGLHIPSHRAIYNYTQIPSIPTQPKTKAQVYAEYSNDVKNRYLQSGGRSTLYSLKENLISLAVFGYGNMAVTADQDAQETFEGYQDVLRKILPDTLGFQRLKIVMPEVLLECTTGHFPLDAVSGGVAALIDLSWQVFTFSEKKLAYTVTFDEPENHLHPRMQKSVLPNMLAAFPQGQFIVATHNPLVISSVADSSVYVLDYDVNGTVVSKQLDFVNKAATSNEILRDVLGLDATIPYWAEARLKELISEYSQRSVSTASLDELRGKMKDVGLEQLFPTATGEIVKRDRLK